MSHEPDPRYEWHELRTLGGSEPRLIRGRCLHLDTVPVEATGGSGIVAHLCLTCDGQLPA